MTEKLEDTNEKLSNVQQTNENLVSKLASSTRENQTLERVRPFCFAPCSTHV
jgi:hypothetical protein